MDQIKYRNKGAPIRRADGTVIYRGVSFIPTAEELRTRAYKLVRVSDTGADPVPEGPAPVAEEVIEESPAPLDHPDVEQYHVGRGWYDIPGTDRKLRRDEAVRALQ